MLFNTPKCEGDVSSSQQNDYAHIIVEGCCHGELDTIYNTVERVSKEHNVKIDLLIICGDFQSVRNEQDLSCLACPVKYREMNTFYKYYSGEKRAPVLTLFVGGNHEASNYLAEIPYGGWVAPNIYYMGWASVVSFCGLTIAGISGIYKQRDFHQAHHEFPPYDNSTLRTTYHVRNLEVYRLLQYTGNVDIFFSHDWPLGIHDFGNTQELLRKKKFLASDIAKNELGSEANLAIMKALKPSYYFAAHLHAKFAAVFPHKDDDDALQCEPSPLVDNRINGVRVTKFLALDKVLPNRPFIQYLSVPCVKGSKSPVLKHDLEWLSILKATNSLLSVYPSSVRIPSHPVDQSELSKCCEEVGEAMSEEDLIISADRFQMTVKPYDPKLHPKARLDVPQPPVENNQYTDWLCNKLKIKNPVVEYYKLIEAGELRMNSSCTSDADNLNSSNSSFQRSFMSTPGNSRRRSSFMGSNNDSQRSIKDPNEIDLDQSSEDEDPSIGISASYEAHESFSESNVAAIDDSEILKQLNSALDESRSDPSAIDISTLSDEPKEKVLKEDPQLTSQTLSSPVMQSTPLGLKTFKRRNTATKDESTTS